MKMLGWLYLALLIAFQLIGWFCFGQSEAFTALVVMIVPSSLLSGAAFFGFFFWGRSWTWLPVVSLVFVQVEVIYAHRTTPSSALLRHAMSQFLEREVGGWEAYFGGTVLLVAMLLMTALAAFGTAEGYCLFTGQRERGGRALFREAGRLFARWDKQVTGGGNDES
ncbi:MAG: hypothetical protein R3F13_01325 [Prosthecobacter sp.]